MSSSNLNMYAGAFLGTVFAMMSVGILGEAIFHEEAPEQAGFAIAVEESSGGEATEEAGPSVEPIAPLLASADVSAGEGVFKKCQACHTVEEGGANKVGPNLWNIVNRPVASHEGFKYSSSMIAFAEGGTVWDYAHLNVFSHKPKDLVPGTAMGFAGLKKVEDRANLVAYLRTMAPEPAPLPDPNAAAEEEGAAEEMPAAEPASMEQPADAEAPAATEETTTEEAPAAMEEPAAAEEPAATEEPATMEEPATDEAPAAMDEPAAAEEPAATEEPAAQEAPAATEEPAATDSGN